MTHIARRRRLGAVLATTTLLAGAVAPAADAAPKRIAALTPFTANTLADLGVRPVGIGMTLGGNDRISPKLRGVPRLRLSHPNGPNLEQLAQLNPQLVLSAPIWRKGEAGMRRLGMRVALSDPTSVAAVPREVQRIGSLVGRRRAADGLAARMVRDINAATRGIRRHPKVLVVLGVGKVAYAFLENSWGGDVIRYAGGRLITAGLRSSGGYARISDEAIVARNPDVIIAVPHGNPSDIGRIAREIQNRPGWRRTNAARRGKVFVSTGNSLLQAFTDVGRTIRDVRRKFLGT
ncbi:ABC transporter substrate-binding protein [Conexibacter sp. SYSU D00693]|uniref:ABC transporter substrate-binding protein n=1 Tax=Conexibacter sp. SYSU D00693 TaxID=2812560 RepID=UPI00196B2533|nr:ABC transporter substrate-binding protein [Conexibacter sp. SYSU D00693]